MAVVATLIRMLSHTCTHTDTRAAAAALTQHACGIRSNARVAAAAEGALLRALATDDEHDASFAAACALLRACAHTHMGMYAAWDALDERISHRGEGMRSSSRPQAIQWQRDVLRAACSDVPMSSSLVHVCARMHTHILSQKLNAREAIQAAFTLCLLEQHPMLLGTDHAARLHRYRSDILSSLFRVASVPALPPADMRALHLVMLTCEIDAPALVQELSRIAGVEQLRAAAAVAYAQTHVPRPRSREDAFARQVYDTCKHVLLDSKSPIKNGTAVHEYVCPGAGLSVDCAVLWPPPDSSRSPTNARYATGQFDRRRRAGLALECDGPAHFAGMPSTSLSAVAHSSPWKCGTYVAAAAGLHPAATLWTRWKRRMLEAHGWHVFNIPHWRWPSAGARQKEAMIRNALVSAAGDNR